MGFAIKKGATLWVSWVVTIQSTQPKQGSSHAQHTKGNTARHREICSRIHSSYVDSLYHRVFSRRRWCSWRLAHGLATFILDHWLPQGQAPLVGDDTVDEHRGKKVYGNLCTSASKATGLGQSVLRQCQLVCSAARGSRRKNRPTTKERSQTALAGRRVGMTPQQIIETYTGRWSIETTLPARWRRSFSIRWPGKSHAAFSDAIHAVRRWLWVEWVFVTHGQLVPQLQSQLEVRH